MEGVIALIIGKMRESIWSVVMSADSQPLLIHLHIPKNAGTTLGRSLRLALGLWPLHRVLHYQRVLGYYNLRGYQRRLEHIATLSPRQQGSIRLFEAHAGYGLHESLPTPNAYITLLRDPVDRVLSIYFAHRSVGRFSKDVSLSDFLHDHEPGRIWWIDNAQVRYLAGEGGDILDCPRGKVTQEHLELAKHRLENEFLSFGLVEEFDRSLILLRRRLGWKHLYYRRSHVTKSRRAKDEMPKSDLALIAGLNELDIELYEFAAALFHEAVAREGSELEREVEQFQIANRRFNQTVGRLYWALEVPRHLRRWRAERRGELTPRNARQ